MKTQTVMICALVAAGIHNSVNAATTNWCPSSYTYGATQGSHEPLNGLDGAGTGCQTIYEYYFSDPDTTKTYAIRTCKTATSGAVCSQASATFNKWGKDCTHEYTKCDCISCPNCVSDTTFLNYSTGYQRKQTKTCSCGGICTVSKTEWRCTSGYYGSPTSGTSGCTRCPVVGHDPNNANNIIYGTSNAGNNTLITQCYPQVGPSYQDTTGKFSYTGNCYYSK